MLGRLLGGETRSISYQSVWGAGGDWPGVSSIPGINVNADQALKISTVYACVRIYVDTIATLPVDAFFRDRGDRRPLRPKPAWIENPDSGMTRQDHLVQVLMSLFIDGNAFILVLRNGIGDVVALTVLDPSRVQIRRNAARQVEYVYDHKTTFSAEEILHITEMRKPGELRGISRMEQLKDTLGLAKALEVFAAQFFGNGSVTDIVIEAPGNLTKQQVEELRDGWENHHRGLKRAHRPGVLAGGAKVSKVGVDPEESQLLDSRRFAVEDICRAFRVPPSLMGIPGTTSYASVEQNAIQWVRFSLTPIVAHLEAAYSTLLPSTAFIKFNLDSLLRGDTATRFTAYSQALQGGFMSINDVRRLEDLGSVNGGDVVRVPLANVDLNAANLVEMDKRVGMAQKLILSGFDPASVLRALDLPSIDHTGVPSSQLQPIAIINPNDPGAAYPV